MPQPSDRSVLVRNILIATVFLVGAAAVLWFWSGRGDQPGGEGRAGSSAEAIDPETAERPGEPTPATLPAAEPTEPTELEQSWIAAVGSPPRWPESLAAPADCAQIDRELRALCDTIESSKESPDPERLCGMFRQAARELAARPPELAGELRSQETMLSNVFHLFRVLGRQRLSELRAILGSHQDLAEPLAFKLYEWLASREGCGGGAAESITMEPLYDYAAYSFTTMGGQAYLRRRSPKVQALTCFFALQLLDRAVEQNHNPHGVDPRQEIRRCRALVAGQPLVFGDRYLEELEKMARRWEDRTTP